MTGARVAPNGGLTSAVTDHGYTGHEQLDNVNLIHMGGRVYYPALGQFISADPTVQFPKYGQSLNAANTAIGTAAGVASGADFESSFYASAFTAAASTGVAANVDNFYAGAIISATIGGTASEISGGKFANGAVTGAFGYVIARAAAESDRDDQFEITPRDAVPGDQSASVEIEIELDYRFRRTILSGKISGELVPIGPRDIANAYDLGRTISGGYDRYVILGGDKPIILISPTQGLALTGANIRFHQSNQFALSAASPFSQTGRMQFIVTTPDAIYRGSTHRFTLSSP